MYKHTLELEQITDLCEYSEHTYGERKWPWYYTTEGIDVYSMQRTDRVTVYWEDEQAAMLFVLKHGADWHIHDAVSGDL